MDDSSLKNRCVKFNYFHKDIIKNDIANKQEWSQFRWQFNIRTLIECSFLALDMDLVRDLPPGCAWDIKIPG